jgi:hypothetical protein
VPREKRGLEKENGTKRNQSQTVGEIRPPVVHLTKGKRVEKRGTTALGGFEIVDPGAV